MLMTIDVGNTNITVGIFDQQQLAATFRMTTKTPRTSDELGMQLRMMLSARQIDWISPFLSSTRHSSPVLRFPPIIQFQWRLRQEIPEKTRRFCV